MLTRSIVVALLTVAASVGTMAQKTYSNKDIGLSFTTPAGHKVANVEGESGSTYNIRVDPTTALPKNARGSYWFDIHSEPAATCDEPEGGKERPAGYPSSIKVGAAKLLPFSENDAEAGHITYAYGYRAPSDGRCWQFKATEREGNAGNYAGKTVSLPKAAIRRSFLALVKSARITGR